MRILGVIALLMATLTACGGGSDGDSGTDKKASAPSAAPADGAKISTDEFSYTVPKGWKQSDQGSVLSLAVDVTDKDGFSDNINVVNEPGAVGRKSGELEEGVEKALKGVNADEITVKDPIQIDGEEAAHVSAIFDLNGNKYRTEQYAVAHGKSGYVVTLSFNLDSEETMRDEVSESILTTWAWAS